VGGSTSICELRCPRLYGRRESDLAHLSLHPTIGATIIYSGFTPGPYSRRRYARCVAIVPYSTFPDSSSERLRTITSPPDQPEPAERFVQTHSMHLERINEVLSHWISFQDLEGGISIQGSTIALLVSAEIYHCLSWDSAFRGLKPVYNCN
jgi:hypothetical protein